MKYKILAPDDSAAYALGLVNERALSQLFGDDTFSSLLRKCIQESTDKNLFELNAFSAKFPKGVRTIIKERIDFFSFFGFIGVLSADARDLMISHGIERNSFCVCQIKQIPNQSFYFFLPQKSYDVLDIKKSVFRSFTPASPPEIDEDLISGIQKLVLLPSKTKLPSCFLLKYPSLRKREFPEIIVSEAFSQSWLGQRMIGAKFFS
jgi:hypothetical protein